MVDPEKVIRRAKDRVLPGFSAKSKWDQPFFFIQAADTQLGKISHKKSLITIFGHKHIKIFLKNLDIFHRKTKKNGLRFWFIFRIK